MILPLYRAGYRPVYSPLGIVVADHLVTPVGRLSFSRVSANPSGPSPRSRSFARICAIGESARSVREIGSCPTFALTAPKRAAVLAVEGRSRPTRWDGDRRPTRSQRDFVDRSRSAQCAQRGGVRFPLPSAGDAPDRLRLHHRGRRTVAATPAAVPIALGDGVAAEVKTRRPPLRLDRVVGSSASKASAPTSSASECCSSCSTRQFSVAKEDVAQQAHRPTCVSACVAW